VWKSGEIISQKITILYNEFKHNILALVGKANNKTLLAEMLVPFLKLQPTFFYLGFRLRNPKYCSLFEL
jgi:hypothetical protein